MAFFRYSITITGDSDMTKENISSQCNGTRTTFTINANFESDSLRVYYNGIRQTGAFSIISDNQFELSFTPQSGDLLEVDYVASST